MNRFVNLPGERRQHRLGQLDRSARHLRSRAERRELYAGTVASFSVRIQIAALFQRINYAVGNRFIQPAPLRDLRESELILL